MSSPSKLHARFRCFARCNPDASFPITQAIYRCPSCQGLLTVEHDLDALKRTSGKEWRKLFDGRLRSTRAPLASGIWSKREWVAPEITDEHVVTTGEGMTPLFHAARLGREIELPSLFVKQCGSSHTGSFKDLGMTVLVSVVYQGVKTGALRTNAIACASTGDTSAALAAYGAICGLPVVVLLPRGLVSNAQLVQPLAHGARVLALETDFDGCMKIVQELARRELIYLANSMNPLRIEGQKTVALEIAQQLEWEVPDWIVLPSGNLGNAAALYAGFKMMLDLGVTDRLPRLCVAQAANANPMYLAYVGKKSTVDPITAKRSHASAIQIGNPVSAPRAMAALQAMDGVVEQATEDELADACARADRTGLYTDPHTGVALAAMFKLRERGLIQASDRVVVVSTANGLKFTEFKAGYHEKKLAEVDARRANAPEILPADVEVVAALLS